MNDKIKLLKYIFKDFDNWKNTFGIMEKIITIDFIEGYAYFTYKTYRAIFYSSNRIKI